tara:strand:- start:318 stop:716 length:399 start_codon:yes stop_codon:yes gene_type:complete
MALRAIIIFLTIGNLSTLYLFGSEFTKTVLPTLQKKCISCHREPYKTKYGRIKKPKGKLILNTPSGIKRSVTPNKPNQSLLYKRVILNKEDDKFMPPQGKEEPLTEKELKNLRDWIQSGAKTGNWKGSKFYN